MNIDSLIDMELIRQSLASYARGIDRQDLELVLGAYWPDGWDAHGTHEGTPAEFGAFVSRQWPMLRMQHLLGQSHIELDGKFANVETYFFAHQHLVEGGSEWVIAGRYDDRFEKRGEDWKVLHRVVVFDWRKEWALSEVDVEKLDALPNHNRGATHSDYSWDLFASKPLKRPAG
ncbi:nuclear transport factor 2 family protein [Novosphingobium colocasiae]|uniref:SnoaL-like domain-containing protein n=1 Tax=Novosphingobium colocasiae TaxID=1256513 RepID=A0A918PP57_9SPHN|nr:nuclear transport factor 2 family protein [Novosphingobium colocasiae]GGZ16371.1 hypothetical protein GCM10011614_33950 [Novosphingobium colocasiae]